MDEAQEQYLTHLATQLSELCKKWYDAGYKDGYDRGQQEGFEGGIEEAQATIGDWNKPL